MNANYLESIIEGCKRGDRVSQEQLYKSYASKMFPVCMRYAKDSEEAEDILHDGFIKVYNKIHSFNYSGSFEGWLRRIMVNTAIESYRKKKFLTSSVELSDSENNFSTAIYQYGSEVKDLLSMIAQLPGTYRIIFNMYAIEGYSHKEIASELRISEILSRTQLSRARTILKNKLAMTDIQPLEHYTEAS